MGCSIVIPTMNNSSFTIKCMDSILSYTEKPFKLVWVDNGSAPEEWNSVSDKLGEFSDRGIPTMHVRFPVNQGFTAAVNAGIQLGGNDDVVLLNNDTMVSPEWLLKMQEALRGDVGIVGVTSNDFDFQSLKNLHLPDVDHITNANAVSRCGNKYDIICDVPMVAFFCVLIARKVFNAVGPMSEDYRHGLAGDNEYCYMARKMGFRVVWRRDAYATHYGGKTFKALGIDRERIAAGERKRFKDRFDS